MMISSRTPEGEYAQCPVCDAGVQMEPSLFYSDAPCPACGSLLWFVRLGYKNVLVQPTDEARRKGLERVLSDVTGLSIDELRDPDILESADLDSMELVEIAMRLEEEADRRDDDGPF